MKILVVDDSKMARKSVIKKIPEAISQDAEIFEAENGQEALFLFKTARPDVVFLDLTMPVMTGYEALEKIRQIDSEAFVVVVSADVQPMAVEQVMALGAKKFIPKDVDPAEIAAIFEMLFARS